MKSGWKQYFEFSRRERVAVVILVVIIITLWIIPLFFASSPFVPGELSVMPLSESFDASGDNFKSNKHDTNLRVSREGEKYNHEYDDRDPSRETSQPSAALFYFDPNTADEKTWKRLGLKDRQVKTILNYISKGGRFRKAEDIQRIYGLSELEAGRLMPFVKIGRVDRPSLKYREEWEGRNKGSTYPGNNLQAPKYSGNNLQANNQQTPRKAFSNKPVEINTAREEDLDALPGIGKVLSKRILVFRDKLGGFYSADQVAETYGLADSTFQKIRPFLRCDSTLVKRIPINDSNDSLIFTHPYFRGRLAQLISSYRLEHGSFPDHESLKNLPLVDGLMYSKIFPYIDLKAGSKNPP